MDYSCHSLPIQFALANEIPSSVSFPEDAVTTLESHEHVDNVELDKEAKTQV